MIIAHKPQAGSGAWLIALCCARVLSASWFVAYSAVLPLTQMQWGLSGKEAGWIQSAFHLGYLLSLFVVGFLADHFGAKRTYFYSGIAGFLSPILFIVFADGFWSAWWLHLLTGLCQGGSYTPVLALVADYVPQQRRGRAMGWMIAASSAGYALCLGLVSLVLPYADWRGALSVVASASLLAWMCGALALHGTANRIHARPPGESLFAAIPAVWRNARCRLSIAGYSAHNWELLGMWAWLPTFLTAALSAHGQASAQVASVALALASMTYVANIGGSVLGGVMADRWGRSQTILFWSGLSALLSLTIGWLIALPIALLVAIACVYNLAGIADSSTHSTVLAESVPPHQVGAAYAMRSLIGFGAGVVSPVVFGAVLDFSGGGRMATDASTWGWAWMSLGLVALLGPLATFYLQRTTPTQTR